MKKTFLSIIILLTISLSSVMAQNYSWGVGLRLGSPFGVTINKTTSPGALEFILGGVPFFNQYKGISFTGLYEIYASSGTFRGVDFYYGFGGHIGFYNTAFFGGGGRVNFGPDVIIGAAYELEEIPVVISVDFKPAVNLFDPFKLFPDAALTFRYTVW